MTITHRPKSSGSALSANVDESTSQIDDKEPPKYHCDACSNDVTNTVRIRCADKNCPDFDLCVTCFCSGSEPVKHKTWHEYRVVKPHTFPIFSEDWDADEELLLIQAAEKNGIGNWQAIAEYVGTRNKTECEQHYLDVYVASPKWPMPPMDKVFDVLTEHDYRERKRQRLQLSRSPRKPPPPVTTGKPVSSQPAFHELQGYMPRRYDFEIEHENEAEQHVKDMVFNDDDTQEEIDLKIMVLDIYNSRLDKRQERKQLIFERGWLEFKKLQAMDRRRQKEERDIYNKTRVFCRLQTAEDYDMFVQGLIKEQHLRDRIAALTEWRQAGLTTLRHGDQYERDKQARLSHLKTVSALSNDRINGTYQQRGGLRAQMAALAPCPGASYYRERLLSPSNTIKKQQSSLSYQQHHLNIMEADGYHLLTKEEQDICSTLYMMPRPYLVIKDLILKQYAKQGFLKRKQLRDLVRIDSTKANRIFDFFVENGWIKAWQNPAEVLAAQQWEQQQQILQLQQIQEQSIQEQAAAMAAATASSMTTTTAATTTTTTTAAEVSEMTDISMSESTMTTLESMANLDAMAMDIESTIVEQNTETVTDISMDGTLPNTEAETSTDAVETRMTLPTTSDNMPENPPPPLWDQD
ncbi:uncharacterized protein BX664DRAFT_343253 [Halteromyces radiatus]|uniref:uncharacterized protein n=1 Tax=Halteromyces radiatus TaxID=101107 RepID=UPI00221F4326|nr:uncharacterized protein BX664DRAFT_343253 [Halteromyces radiatus]KAI8077696.1 hypothetical protein BX664DRAFT_343253 [Halteromyces radiatus]